MYQLVDSEVLYEKEGLIFFKHQLFSGVLMEELGDRFEKDNFLCEINLTCIRDGKRIGRYLPPYFPEELFDLNNLRYMWVNRSEYGEYGFFEDLKHPEFTGILFQGNPSFIDMPDIWDDLTDYEWELQRQEYNKKLSIDYPMTLDELSWGGGVFYAVIHGKNEIDRKIIYQIDDIGGPTLNCILDGKRMKVLKNTDLFNIDHHILFKDE